jgi:hypothetical protein
MSDTDTDTNTDTGIINVETGKDLTVAGVVQGPLGVGGMQVMAGGVSSLFDTMDALTLIMLWIVFGYLGVLINCDIQRLIASNPLFLHAAALVAFLFLMTTTDPNNKEVGFGIIVLKTIFVYTIFLLITKSKWYFALPVVLLLLVDQTIKRIEVQRNERRLSNNTTYKYGLIAIVTTLVFLGTVNYASLQMKQYGRKFSWFNFFFGVSRNCRRNK